MDKIYSKEDATKLLQSIYGAYVEHKKIAEIINQSTKKEFPTSYLKRLGKIIEKNIERTETRKI